ncbi:hypothetical protein ACC703_12875 [Rhizobium ruizarguesonis]
MKQSLSTRIATRIALVTKWLKTGVPPGLEGVPTTLNKWREWHKPELGIFRIGSKSGFTTKDPDFGPQVLTLQSLVSDLNEKMGLEAQKTAKANKRHYQPEYIKRKRAEHDRDAALRDVKTIAGQWHHARHELALKTKEWESLKGTFHDLHAALRERDDRIQYLLGRLRSAGIREV